MQFKSYESMAEMMKDMEENRARADERVQEWQSQITVGDCFARYDDLSDLIVYGEILDPAQYHGTGTLTSDQLAEIAEEALVYQQPHMKNFRFCRAYSPAVEEGELGDVHVSTIGIKLHRAVFDLAREMHWPQTEKALVDEAVKRGILIPKA